jgi:hypothetical protein
VGPRVGLVALEKKNLLHLKGIKPKYLDRPVLSIVTMPTEMYINVMYIDVYLQCLEQGEIYLLIAIPMQISGEHFPCFSSNCLLGKRARERCFM